MEGCAEVGRDGCVTEGERQAKVRGRLGRERSSSIKIEERLNSFNRKEGYHLYHDTQCTRVSISLCAGLH